MANVIKLKEVASTNSYALENIDSLNDKDIILAEKQTAGKGRLGRKWVGSDSKNVYMSIVLKLCNQDFPYSNLTQYLSVVVARILEKYGVKPSIKWPNDILVDSSKIAGILCEAKNRESKIYALVLGLGVNLNMGSDVLASIDQKATSLKMLLSKDIDVDKFANVIIEEFFNAYDEFITKGFPYIRDEYIARCDFLGKRIKVLARESKEEVIAKSISDTGELIVVDFDKNEKKILTGDITYI